MKRFRVHNIDFIRTGECNQCGGCKRECLECPHGEIYEDGTYCTIYDKRYMPCSECSERRGKMVTHQICIDFPNHPWLNVVRQGMCGYQFERVDGRSMDDLPFVDGKFRI